MCNDACFGCRSMHGIVSSYALYDDLVAEVSKQAKAACHYCILHKRGKVKSLFFYLTTYFLCFFSFSFSHSPTNQTLWLFFSSSGHLSFFFPFTFFPLLPLICPLLSFSLPPSFPFFFPLSQPPLYLSLPPSLPSPCLSLSLPTCH